MAARLLEARRSEASASRLSELAGDRSPWVRAAVVDNLDAPLHVLAKLLQDRSGEVHFALTTRALQDHALLQLIIEEGSVSLRTYLAQEAGRTPREMDAVADEIRNGLPQQTPAMRQKLQTHLDRYSRDGSPLTLDTQQRLANDDAWQVRAGLASATTHPEILARLVADQRWRVRAQCLDNDLLTAEQAIGLVHDRRRDVRAWAVLWGPLSQQQLDDIAQHERSIDVLDMLIHRPDVTPQVLERIAAHPQPDLPAAATRTLDEQPGEPLS